MAISQPELIGRYQRAELEAMHGKRGRKPPEYFMAFPERVRPAKPARDVADGRSAVGVDPLAERLRMAGPAVRKLVAHLLDVVGEMASVPAGELVADEEVVAAIIPEPIANTAQVGHLTDPVYADPEADLEMVEQV